MFVSADPVAGQILALGDSSVGAGSGAWSGVLVFPGNPPVFVPTDDLAKIYFNSDSASAVACYTYVR